VESNHSAANRYRSYSYRILYSRTTRRAFSLLSIYLTGLTLTYIPLHFNHYFYIIIYIALSISHLYTGIYSGFSLFLHITLYIILYNAHYNTLQIIIHFKLHHIFIPKERREKGKGTMVSWINYLIVNKNSSIFS
jgi:hypothetical protein